MRLIVTLSIIAFTFSGCNKDELTDAEKAERTLAVEQLNTYDANRLFSLEVYNANTNQCFPGVPSQDVLTKALFNINFIRTSAGLNPVVLDSLKVIQTQNALMLFHANKIKIKDGLPIDSTWSCYTKDRYNSYGKCIYINGYNSVGGNKLASLQDGVNLSLILYPQLKKIGYGQLLDMAAFYIYSDSLLDKNIPKPDIIKYPSDGFAISNTGNNFRIMGLNADFSKVKITIKSSKQYETVKILSYNLYNAYYNDYNTLLFQLPNGLPKVDDKKDIKLNIKIENAIINGISKTIEYKVIFIQSRNL